MLETDHNPSELQDESNRRHSSIAAVKKAELVEVSRRCQRRRLRSRSAVRARVRLGLIVSLASLLLLLVMAQWSAQVFHLDVAALLRSAGIVLGVAAGFYLLALVAVARLMRRRRNDAARNADEPMSGSA